MVLHPDGVLLHVEKLRAPFVLLIDSLGFACDGEEDDEGEEEDDE